ncbi:MAG TPA: hypothetical protein VF335_09145 [Chitinivibrionales bacterium]
MNNRSRYFGLCFRYFFALHVFASPIKLDSGQLSWLHDFFQPIRSHSELTVSEAPGYSLAAYVDADSLAQSGNVVLPYIDNTADFQDALIGYANHVRLVLDTFDTTGFGCSLFLRTKFLPNHPSDNDALIAA